MVQALKKSNSAMGLGYLGTALSGFWAFIVGVFTFHDSVFREL